MVSDFVFLILVLDWFLLLFVLFLLFFCFVWRLLVRDFSLSEFCKTFSESVETFGKFGNFRRQNLSKSCLEGPHSELIRKQFLFWTTHTHLKPNVAMQLIFFLDYCV